MRKNSLLVFWSRALVIALGLVIGLGVRAHAQSGKIGWVDLDKIFGEYKEFKDAEALFQKDAQVWEAEFDSMQSEYFSKLEDYKKQRLLLSDATKKTREEELAAQEQNLLQAKAKYESEAERRRAELTAPILKKIQDVVQKIAVSDDLDFVLNGSQTYTSPAGIQFSPIMYAKDKLDLTDRVFEDLSKLK